jgi:hypothetical protein
MMFSSIIYGKMKSPINKFCVNCKHIIKGDGDTLYSKCMKFPTEFIDKNYMVTGVKSYDEYYYCTTARISSDMCGGKAKYYEENTTKK